MYINVRDFCLQEVGETICKLVRVMLEGLRFVIAENVVSIKASHINCGRQQNGQRPFDFNFNVPGRFSHFPPNSHLYSFRHSAIQVNTHWTTCSLSAVLPSHHHYDQFYIGCWALMWLIRNIAFSKPFISEFILIFKFN